MNKLFSKIAIAFASLAMVVGGVISHNQTPTRLDAEGDVPTYRNQGNPFNDTQVLIVSYDGSNYYCLSAENGTDDAPAMVWTYLFSEDKIIVADLDANLFTVERDGDNNLKFRTGTKYLCVLNDDNGVRLSESGNNLFKVYLGEEDFNYQLKNNATNRYLGIDADLGWRSYTSDTDNRYNGSAQKIMFYKRVPTRTLKAINIATSQTKQEYYVDDTFDPTGLVIRRGYTDYTTECIEYENNESYFSFSPSLDTPLKLEDTTVTVTYGGFSANLQFSVFPKPKITTYTFTNDMWAATPDSWINNKEGTQFNSKYGVLVDEKTSGASATSPSVFEDIKSITVTYRTGPYSGTGSITIQNGYYSPQTKNYSYNGDDDLRTLVWDYTNTGLERGQTTITVNCTDDSVNIKSIEINAGTYPRQTISGTKTAYSAETVQLTTNAPNPVWSIVEAETTAPGAAITSDGKVTVTGAGQARVKVSSENYETAYHTITFNETPSGPYMRVDEDKINGYSGAKKTINFACGNINNTLESSSNDDNVATVYNLNHQRYATTGSLTIKFVGAGSTYMHIFDSVTDVTYATLRVTVTASTVTITNYPTTAQIGVGEEYSLKNNISVTTVGAYSNEITWASDNTDVVTVNNQGKITGVSLGEANVTVKGVDDPDSTQTCHVTVARSNFKAVNSFADGKKYILAASGFERNDALSYLPAGTAVVSGNPTSQTTLTATSFTKEEAWTANVDYDDHIVFSNKVGETTYYLNAANSGEEKVTIDTESLGYWEYDDNGLNFNNGVTRYLSCWKDKQFRQYDYPESSNARTVNKIYEYYPIARQEFEELKTQTSLAYRYYKDNEGEFTFTDMVIRFSAVVSKELWNALASEYNIAGFGVVIARGGVAHDQEEMEWAVEHAESSENITDINTTGAINYFVPIENMNSVIGVNGDNYFWNLRFEVEESYYTDDYSAVAYIKLDNDEFILMNMAKTCVEDLAEDYLKNRGYEDDYADGSLAYLAGYCD